jgi:hypothetical protein
MIYTMQQHVWAPVIRELSRYLLRRWYRRKRLGSQANQSVMNGTAGVSGKGVQFSSADVARRLMLTAKRENRQFVVKT